MEMNMWIAKDETSQMTSGFASCTNNGMYIAYPQQQPQQPQQQQQQYSNVRALLESNPINPNFYVPDGYAQELDNAGVFCLDDFFTSPGSKDTMECEPMTELNVKTESYDQYQSDCWTNQRQSTVDFASCQSPADSGVSSVAPSFSPNGSEFGRADLESPRSVESGVFTPANMMTTNGSNAIIDEQQWMMTGGSGNNNGGQQASGTSSNEVGFEIYHDLIMRHLVQDIKATCVRLNIPQDPKLWTPSDSRAWLTDMSAQYHLAQVPYEKLSMNGSTLCGMTLAQFNQCFPNGGETVHAQLQIWNSANEYCKRQSSSTHGSRLSSTSSCTDYSTMIPGMTSSTNQNYDQHNQQQQSFKCMDDDLTGYVAAQFVNSFQLPQQQQQQQQTHQFGQATTTMNSGYIGLLPSPGSCSDGGQSIDFETSSESNGSVTNNNNNNNIHLWQFLRELLDQQDKFSHCVRWVDQAAGIFKIEDSHKLARLWGQRKNRPAMNYDKLSRSLRQYYKKGILKKTTRSQRLVYQFLHPYHMC